MTQDLNIAFTVDRSPAEVFAAVKNVRGWWSVNAEGATEKVGDEFTFSVQQIHYSKHVIDQTVPNKQIGWKVIDSYLTYLEDHDEWTGTRFVFDIEKVGDKTAVRFTHEGLNSSSECFDACFKGWSFYVGTSLVKLIETGKGEPAT